MITISEKNTQWCHAGNASQNCLCTMTPMINISSVASVKQIFCQLPDPPINDTASPHSNNTAACTTSIDITKGA